MALILNARRAGNTTRQVDEWIQELFTKGQVRVVDHAFSETNQAQTCAANVLINRLKFEHHLEIKKDFTFSRFELRLTEKLFENLKRYQ